MRRSLDGYEHRFGIYRRDIAKHFHQRFAKLGHVPEKSVFRQPATDDLHRFLTVVQIAQSKGERAKQTPLPFDQLCRDEAEGRRRQRLFRQASGDGMRQHRAPHSALLCQATLQ